MANGYKQLSQAWLKKFLGGLVALVFALATLPALAQQPSPSLISGAKKNLKQQAKPKPKPKTEEKKASPAPSRPTPPSARRAMRRDPFRSLKKLAEEGGPGQQQLPPGKRGLVVAQLVVEGIVVGATGRIAVVTMPGRDRAFFLRERDQLYDGLVTAILGDRVIFREKTRDLFGRRIERDVTKELVTVPES